MLFSNLMTIYPLDFLLLIAIILVEFFLSIDNMIVLSRCYTLLEPVLRKRTFWIGVGSALIIRAAMILFASFILKSKPLLLIGSLYLLYLCAKSFLPKKASMPFLRQTGWVFLQIELIDFLFSLDALVVSFSLITMVYGPNWSPDHLWLIYVGALIGLFLVRRTALKLAERVFHPRVERGTALLLGCIGLNLLLGTLGILPRILDYLLEMASLCLLILLCIWIYIDFKKPLSLK